MTKNARISFYILVPVVFWMVSGLFKIDNKEIIKNEDGLFNVQTVLSVAENFQPLIKLKATTQSETRIDVKAKTSGEVVKIVQGEYIIKDSLLCSLGVVELNRTDAKALSQDM